MKEGELLVFVLCFLHLVFIFFEAVTTSSETDVDKVEVVAYVNV